MTPIEIWQVAAEARPLAQAGGLADVMRALPSALARAGHRVRRFLPAYGSVNRSGFTEEPPALKVPLGSASMPVRFLSRAEPDGVITTLVVCDELFGRPEIYGPAGREFPDNARRFTLFSRAVTERAKHAAKPPEILHVHDWHVALAPLFARFDPALSGRIGTVLTIHNMGYQGRYPAEEIRWLSLEAALRTRLFRPEGIEFYGGINFLKAGLLYSHRITTVSPTYAREILTEEFGCGLEGVLEGRRAHLSGILNGADYELWNPGSDPNLPQPYGPDALEGKEVARQALREDFGLKRGVRPLLGVVSRLVHQKGIDILAQAVPGLWEAGADLVILGDGEPALVKALRRLRNQRPRRTGLEILYDDRLAHRVTAGSDFILLPSRYEPCGLTQMYALRYGTIPVVTPTGGLLDTVRDESTVSGRGTGFWMKEADPESLVEAAARGMAFRRASPPAWRALQRRAMAEDFSWAKAARSYADLYEEILRDPGSQLSLADPSGTV
jgi:starch synthase